MTTVVLVQASPRNPVTGVAVDYRLAGGGSTTPYLQAGFNDWRAGVATIPRYSTSLDFGENGFTGGAVPQTSAVRFYPSDAALLSELANLYWPKARIQIRTGNDDSASASYAIKFVGRVADAKSGQDGLTLTMADMSTDLAKPVCPDTFLGTGDLEGDASAEGRIKRRSWGAVFNVEGQLLDAASLTYEFGDPNKTGNQIVAVRDKAVVGSPTSNIAWAGSALATLNALKAATVPAGGYVTAHSINCARWYTTPVGPLTADLADATAAIKPATVAARIVGEFSTEITVGNLSDALAWQRGSSGLLVDSSSETVGNALDRLLTFASTLWIVGVDAVLNFRQIGWTAATNALTAETVERETQFAPLDTRKVGYHKNHRVMTDSEVSPAISASGKPQFVTDARYVLREIVGATDRWGTDAITSTVVSPYELRPDASDEANAQGIFLRGPLARDRIVVQGLLHDLIGTVATVTWAGGLGYVGGADVFVIGVQEDDRLPVSTLTVLKRL